MNLAIHIADLLVHLPQLPDQRKKRGPRKLRDEIVIIVVDQRDQHSDAGNALSGYDAELRQVAAQGVYQHCPLPDQELAEPMQHQHALLFLALHRNEAHRRPRHRLANLLGVGRVILLPLHVWLDVRRRHQPNLVTLRHKNPGPVVSSRACLDSDQTWRQGLEESNDIVAAQLAAAHDRASAIDSVNLKYMLGDIETNCGNLLHRRPPLCDFRQPHFGTLRCRERRPSTTSGDFVRNFVLPDNVDSTKVTR